MWSPSYSVVILGLVIAKLLSSSCHQDHEVHCSADRAGAGAGRHNALHSQLLQHDLMAMIEPSSSSFSSSSSSSSMIPASPGGDSSSSSSSSSSSASAQEAEDGKIMMRISAYTPPLTQPDRSGPYNSSVAINGDSHHGCTDHRGDIISIGSCRRRRHYSACV